MTTDEHGTEPAKGTRARAAQAGAATARRKGSGRATQRPPDPAAPARAHHDGQGRRLRVGTRARSRPLDPDQLAALVEERDFLLRSLRDLDAEHEAGDVDDGDYAALEDDYTARAAAAIRAIDGHRSRQARPRPPRSMTRRVLVAAAVAVFAVGTGVLVAQWSGTRGVGDSITGGIRSDTRDELVAARQYAGAGQYLQAIKSYDGVLKIDPANIEALAYKGWMYRLVSLQATGTQRTELQSEAQASLRLALAHRSQGPHQPGVHGQPARRPGSAQGGAVRSRRRPGRPAALGDVRPDRPAPRPPPVRAGPVGERGKHDEHVDHDEHVERLTRQSVRPSGGW